MPPSQERPASIPESQNNCRGGQINPAQSSATARDGSIPTRPAKRCRRTKAEIEVFRAEKEQKRLRKEQERSMANLVRAQEKAQKASTWSARSSWSQSWAKAKSQSQSQNESEEVEDQGKLFVHQDYLNMITYLEDSQN
jgi:hypothetical protein